MEAQYKAKSLSWNGTRVETGAFPWASRRGKFCLRFSVPCAFCPCGLPLFQMRDRFNSGTLPRMDFYHCVVRGGIWPPRWPLVAARGTQVMLSFLWRGQHRLISTSVFWGVSVIMFFKLFFRQLAFLWTCWLGKIWYCLEKDDPHSCCDLQCETILLYTQSINQSALFHQHLFKKQKSRSDF